MKNKIVYILKIAVYILIIAVYVLTAIHYILGRIYALGEYVWYTTNLLPDSIWKHLELSYYEEAGGIKFILDMAVFIVLIIVSIAIYRRVISKTTLTLFVTTVVSPLLYIVSGYTENRVLITVMFVIFLIHFVSTTVFLIKDISKFK